MVTRLSDRYFNKPTILVCPMVFKRLQYFMGQQNSSYRSLILPVLVNLFQRTLFRASKKQITKSSTSSAVRVFSKVWCLHYHMTKKNMGVIRKLKIYQILTKHLYSHTSALPNINANYQMHLLKDALINTLNKSSWAQKSRYKNMS